MYPFKHPDYVESLRRIVRNAIEGKKTYHYFGIRRGKKNIQISNVTRINNTF